MPKPFVAYNIERFPQHDCAVVEVVLVTFLSETTHKREVLSRYETLSRGATASARKEMKKYAHLAEARG